MAASPGGRLSLRIQLHSTSQRCCSTSQEHPLFENADLIHRYTPAEALRDGVLIDVSATAREAGLRWPVALTAAAWARCIAVPAGVVCQDEAGRLWDLVWMLRLAIGRAGGGPEVRFSVHVRNDNRDRTPPLVRLYLISASGSS
jgi:hypothetical protein